MPTEATIRSKAGTMGRAAEFHRVGSLCALAAGAWLGMAEAPVRMADVLMRPGTISLCMVAGVFVARWSFPTLIRGTGAVLADLRARAHLMVWAVLAGALWAVGNTLTVYAIRDVGLSVAFPLWNANGLIGLFWGVVLFRELRGASRGTQLRVVAGAHVIVLAAILLGLSLMRGQTQAQPHLAEGVAAALGAGLMWGTMYVPYRKAYLSGMNPLSFVKVFTVGELGTMTALAVMLAGGARPLELELSAHRGSLFWIFLGGFCWVVGDMFQQYATKLIGIGRGISLSNTNQLWGMLWGAFAFGEMAGATAGQRWMIVGGSVLMVVGTVAISSASASAGELRQTEVAMEREARLYGLAASSDTKPEANPAKRRQWDWLILVASGAVFLLLARQAKPPVGMAAPGWAIALAAAACGLMVFAGQRLWRATRFA